VFFENVGTHTIYLTGNIVIETNRGGDYDSEDDYDDYDLSPDEDELDDEEDSDELDDIDDPRITELPESEDEAVEQPKAKAKAGKKRPAEDEEEDLDSMIKNAAKEAISGSDPSAKLSKKQAKKLKKNDGQATAAATPAASAPEAKATTTKTDKKVSFAKQLEQTAPAATDKKNPPKKDDSKKADAKPAVNGDAKEKAGRTTTHTQGVKIEETKSGKGPAAKKGSKVSMRYIGKLTNGKVFDCKFIIINHQLFDTDSL
jgi:FK506-binding nuclear protein